MLPHVADLARALKQAPGAAGLARIAAHAGVDPTVAMTAAKGQPVGVDAYLRLCAAAGIDPLDGRDGIARCQGRSFHWNSFGIAVRMRRIQRGQTQRELAAAIHLSATAICRIERGAEPQTGTLMGPVGVGAVLTVCRALGLHPNQHLRPVAAPVCRETPTATKPRPVWESQP